MKSIEEKLMDMITKHCFFEENNKSFIYWKNIEELRIKYIEYWFENKILVIFDEILIEINKFYPTNEDIIDEMIIEWFKDRHDVSIKKIYFII